MLETVREFALERLDDSVEKATVRQRHAAFYMRLAQQAEAQLTSPRRKSWLALLRHEQNNFRAALAWLIRERADAAGGLRLAGALSWMWYFAAHFTEGRAWLKEALALAEESADLAARAKALSGAARLATYAGDVTEAVDLGDQSVELWRRTNDARGLAFALIHQGIPSMIQRQAAARAMFEESVACFRRAGDAWGVAFAMSYVGVLLAMTPGEEDQAVSVLNEVLARMQALGDDWGHAGGLYLAVIAHRRGNYADARRQAEQGLSVYRDQGDGFRVARTLHQLAETTLALNLPDEALAYLKESLQLTHEQGRIGDIGQQLRLLARVEIVRQRPDRAARAVAAAAQLSAHKSTLPPEDPQLVQQAFDAARRALDERHFQSESAFGAAMAVDQAVRWALADEPQGQPGQKA
jgi:tetratricopeptide (TPR) repeat protein